MIRLHHAHQTRSMRSLWLLHELGVDFETTVHRFDKSLRSPEYLELNPAGRVPALEIDGQVMFETGAIAEYLCECFPQAGLGRLPGDPERMAWLIWLHFAETLSQHGAALTQQHVALYEDHMRSPIVMKLEARRLLKCYAALEDRLAGRSFILDSGFSAVDIGVAQALYMTRHFAKLGTFPNVSAWYATCTARPGFIASCPKQGDVLLYNRSFYEVPDG